MPVNQAIYRLYAPLYDRVFASVLEKGRRRAVQCLELQPGERLLIPGVGTGLDLPLIHPAVRVIGIDISPEMLKQAKSKFAPLDTCLLIMDAQAVLFPVACFDAVLLNLVLSVVPDGQAAFQEAWRVLRPGGRLVIFDKFLPETGRLTGGRLLLGWLVSLVGTDPNRRLSDLLSGTPGLKILREEPSLLRGQYRIVVLHKCESNE